MVFVIVYPVVMLSSSVTTTSRMFPVLSNTSVSSTDMTPLLPVLMQVCKGSIWANVGTDSQSRKDWRLKTHLATTAKLLYTSSSSPILFAVIRFSVGRH